MPRKRRKPIRRIHAPSVHETLGTVMLAFAAVIAAVVGSLSAAVTVGLLGSSTIVGSVWMGESTLQQDQLADWREEETSTISVVNQVAPAVVSIRIKKSFPAGDAYAPLVEIGGGTGFFVSQDGLIVTNRHVVSDREARYFAVTHDGAELSARVVAEDPFLDIAILDVEGTGYQTAVLGDSLRVRPGQTVIAVGNTLSAFPNTVTKGIVSGVNREVTAGDGIGTLSTIDHAIQTDAAINLGNSGGPLMNLSGEVIGVNTAVSIEGQSIGFAIPINDVKKAVTDVASFGRIMRPWLGVRYVMLTPHVAEERGLTFAYGALLVRGSQSDMPAVVPESPAAVAGLKEGDVILSVNGQVLDQDVSLAEVMEALSPGQRISLHVARGAETQQISVTLAELPLDFSR